MFAGIVLAVSLGAVFAVVPPGPYGTGTCTGPRQSPIDLILRGGFPKPTFPPPPPTVHAPIQFRNYFNGHFNKAFEGALLNNGETVVWFINPNHGGKLSGGKMWKWKNPSIRDGPFGGITHTHTYYLWKIEFRWGEPGVPDKGSDHTIDGERFPLEMQIIHVEDNFVEKNGKIEVDRALGSEHGFAIISILFKVDPKKPQNQEPLSDIDDKVWEMNWPGSHSKRALDLDLKEVEEQETERDHEINMRQLQYGFSQLKSIEEKDIEKRKGPYWDHWWQIGDSPFKLGLGFGYQDHKWKWKIGVKVTFRIGAYFRKVNGGFRNNAYMRKGAAKDMSTYWTYKGSSTKPPCEEAVTWVVFQRPLPIAQVQANAFSSLYSNNWRPTQNVSAEHNVQHLIHNCIDCECKCH